LTAEAELSHNLKFGFFQISQSEGIMEMCTYSQKNSKRME